MIIVLDLGAGFCGAFSIGIRLGNVYDIGFSITTVIWRQIEGRSIVLFTRISEVCMRDRMLPIRLVQLQL